MCYVFLILANVSVIYLAELFIYALVGLQSGVDVSIGGNRLVFVIVADDVTYALGVDGQAGCKVNGIERAVRLVLTDVLIFKRVQFILNSLVGLQGGVDIGIRRHRLVFVVVADNIAYAFGVDE